MILKKSWFTLVELMIVIVIMTTIMVLTYAPYDYFQNKAKLKIASSEISQSISEWRNLAISWVKTKYWSGSENKSIAIFLDNTDWNNDKISFYAYSHLTKTGSLKRPSSSDYLLKTKKLQKWILLNQDKSLLFFFEAISWELSVFSFDPWKNSPNLPALTGSIEIKYSFKNSNIKSLNKTMYFNTETNIVNY